MSTIIRAAFTRNRGDRRRSARPALEQLDMAGFEAARMAMERAVRRDGPTAA